jgi:hypothetical protein
MLYTLLASSKQRSIKGLNKVVTRMKFNPNGLDFIRGLN